MKKQDRGLRCSSKGIFAAVALVLSGAGVSRGAEMIFKSNFGPGVSLGPVTSFNTNGAWQSLMGNDLDTGYSWPVAGLKAEFSGIQWITDDNITPETIGNHISSEIRLVPGPKGVPVHEVFQQVKIKTPPIGLGSTAQATFMIKRPWTIGDVQDFYISYWFKHQANLADLLVSTVSSANWRQQFEFKTGGYLNDWHGDYRMGTRILKAPDGKLFWSSKADNSSSNGGPFVPKEYWDVENHDVPVPVGTWFFFEAYWHRSSGSDGRYWAAVNGQVIVDRRGSNMGDYNLPITRIMVNNAYSGGHTPVESHMTELSIWSGFPCGDGVPCYNQKIISPKNLKVH